MTQPRTFYSHSFAKIAVCAAFALTACSAGGGSSVPNPLGADHVSRTQTSAIAPGSGGSARSVAGDGSASAIAYWLIGASDYCPSAKETITIEIAAANSQGELITGNYTPAVVLSDTDKSGATKLSTTSVTKASQSVTLTYSGKKIPSFQVEMTVGKNSGYATFAPGRSCINSAPAVIVAHNGAAGTSFTIKGVGVAGPFSVKSPSSGSGCGNAVTTKKQGAQFVLTSATTGYGYCFIDAVSKSAGASHGIGVILVKK
ncbi:MAG TPA: hypothetical protein VK760_08445 [Candidatus Acidoferrales bacterium]|nr:hypothetical protein [Candidatus Acidoferrales bacterium]